MLKQCRCSRGPPSQPCRRRGEGTEQAPTHLRLRFPPTRPGSDSSGRRSLPPRQLLEQCLCCLIPYRFLLKTLKALTSVGPKRKAAGSLWKSCKIQYIRIASSVTTRFGIYGSLILNIRSGVFWTPGTSVTAASRDLARRVCRQAAAERRDRSEVEADPGLTAAFP